MSQIQTRLITTAEGQERAKLKKKLKNDVLMSTQTKILRNDLDIDHRKQINTHFSSKWNCNNFFL